MRNKPGSAPGVFVLGNRVAGGAYEYTLQQGGVDGDAADGNWYLRSSIKTEPTIPVDPADPVTPVAEIPNYRAEVPVAMAVPALAHRLGLSVLGTYHDRAGEDYVMLPSGSALQGYARAHPDQKERRAWGWVFGETGELRDGAIDPQGHYGNKARDTTSIWLASRSAWTCIAVCMATEYATWLEPILPLLA